MGALFRRVIIKAVESLRKAAEQMEREQPDRHGKKERAGTISIKR